MHMSTCRFAHSAPRYARHPMQCSRRPTMDPTGGTGRDNRRWQTCLLRSALDRLRELVSVQVVSQVWSVSVSVTASARPLPGSVWACHGRPLLHPAPDHRLQLDSGRCHRVFMLVLELLDAGCRHNIGPHGRLPCTVTCVDSYLKCCGSIIFFTSRYEPSKRDGFLVRN